jgi:hypothetical protein
MEGVGMMIPEEQQYESCTSDSEEEGGGMPLPPQPPQPPPQPPPLQQQMQGLQLMPQNQGYLQGPLPPPPAPLMLPPPAWPHSIPEGKQFHLDLQPPKRYSVDPALLSHEVRTALHMLEQMVSE